MKKLLAGLLLTFTIPFCAQAEDQFNNVTINGINVAGMTISEATSALNEMCVPQISIRIADSIEKFSARSIGAEYTEEQIKTVYSQKNNSATILPEYDSEKLMASIHSLFSTQEQNLPQDAKLVYDEGNGVFIISKEVEGTAVNEEAIAEEIQKELEKGWPFWVSVSEQFLIPDKIIEKELKDGWRFWISADDYRLMPETVEEDLKEELDTVNHMLQTDVTISDTVQQVTVNKDTIMQKGMITRDGSINEEAVLAFIDTYNFKTQGIEREITSPATGTFIQGDGVFYGTVDKEKESARLISEIKAGIKEDRYPEYVVSMDDNAGIGNTFIDVSIDDQKVYLIRDGEIEYTADCVTGCVNTAHDTPKGVCYINSKYRNITLQKYNAYVNYWMAFIGSTYGLHDATWRNAFGGDIYLYDGSHGCVNMKYEDVQYFYENTEIGIPVVVH